MQQAAIGNPSQVPIFDCGHGSKFNICGECAEIELNERVKRARYGEAPGIERPQEDGKRIAGNVLAVFKIMRDGKWHTLEELALAIGVSTQGVSARIRDLRKREYGLYTIERQRTGSLGNVHYYRLDRGDVRG